MHKHTIQKSRLHRSNLDGFFSPSHYLSWAYVSCNNSWNRVRFFLVFSRAWNKVQQSPRSGAVPLGHWDSTVSEIYHEVYIWHASYILLFSEEFDWLRKWHVFSGPITALSRLKQNQNNPKSQTLKFDWVRYHAKDIFKSESASLTAPDNRQVVKSTEKLT